MVKTVGLLECCAGNSNLSYLLLGSLVGVVGFGGFSGVGTAFGDNVTGKTVGHAVAIGASAHAGEGDKDSGGQTESPERPQPFERELERIVVEAPEPYEAETHEVELKAEAHAAVEVKEYELEKAGLDPQTYTAIAELDPEVAQHLLEYGKRLIHYATANGRELTRSDLEAILEQGGVPAEDAQTVAYLLEQEGLFSTYDKADKENDQVSSKEVIDIGAVLGSLFEDAGEVIGDVVDSATPSRTDTLEHLLDQLDLYGEGDGKFSREDLERFLESGDLSARDEQILRDLLGDELFWNALDTGAGRGGLDGVVSEDDIRALLYESQVQDAHSDDYDGSIDSRDEAERWLELYEGMADTAAGRGGRDGNISTDDLIALVNNPDTPEPLRDAALYLLENHADDYNSDDCSGFSLCQIGEAYDASGLDSVVDLVWDDTGLDSVVDLTFDGAMWRTFENFGDGSWTNPLEFGRDLFADLTTLPVQVGGNLFDDGLLEGADHALHLATGSWSLPHVDAEWGLPEGAENMDLFVDGVDWTDVSQGQLGSCVTLSGIASVAYQNPEVIENAIVDNGDGTYTVTFHEQRPPGYVWEEEWTTHEVTVSAEVPLDDYGNPIYAETGDGELWVAVLEKAWAEYRGGYHRIDGYVGFGLLEALTGNTASAGGYYADEIVDMAGGPDVTIPSLSKLDSLLADGYAVMASSEKGAEDIPSDAHMYYVQSVDVEAGTVTIGNPWGEGYTQTLTHEQFEENFSATNWASTEIDD